MLVYGFEIQDKTAFSLSGQKRTAYKKGEKILVSKEDKLMLLRLGHKLVDEKELSYKDVFTTKKKADKEA